MVVINEMERRRWLYFMLEFVFGSKGAFLFHIDGDIAFALFM